MESEVKINVSYYMNKLKAIQDLFDKDELNVSFDRLKSEKFVNQELLYFICKNEKKGMFIFSFDFFVKELKDQEFKRMLSFNSLNFEIYNAYNTLKKKCNLNKNCKGVRVDEILNLIEQKKDKKISKPKILRRILILSYYLNWDLKKNDESFDTDYFIEINENYIKKPKQRFNLDVVISIYEDDASLVFVNQKGDLNFVMKNKESFTREDVKSNVFECMKKIFKVKNINIDEN